MQHRSWYEIALVGVLALCAIILVIPIAMRASIAPYTYTDISQVPHTEAALVLGASVVNGKPSPILAERADAAIALFNAGKVSKILVTGDNASTTYDEVNPVQKYLLAAGIPAQDIFLDHAGFDTYSSMYRALHVFGATSITITTQDFHMPRSLWIARHLGLTSYGFVAQGNGSFWDYLREIPASAKALWDVVVHRTPEYLGTPIPLSGNGQGTWY